MTRTLFFLGTDVFHATTWESGRLEESRVFSNDTNGREQFSHYLRETPYPACLLVDMIEEDFRLETIPHLFGPARRELLARKFEQFYRSSPFRQAVLLRRQREGRRDDEMLFSALTNPQRITPWLDLILAHQIPLIGIYSQPHISTPLIRNLPSRHVLLLTWGKDSGLRQTYFNNQRLHFSRLIPSSSHDFVELVIQETPRTQQYLRSLSLPPVGEVLDVYIVCHANDRRLLEGHLQATGDLRYTYLDLEALARDFKSENDYTSSDATPLLLHLLASSPPRSHYASAQHTHFYTLYRLHRSLYGLAASLALASVLWGGLAIWEGYDHAAETKSIRDEIQQLRQQTEAIQRNFVGLDIPAADMKAAVLAMRQLRQYTPPPEDILHELSLVMDQFPQIRLQTLGWKSSAEAAPSSPYPAQVITFEGTLTGFGMDFRRTLAYLDRFQQALSQAGYDVSAEKLPLDISSQGSIPSDLSHSDTSFRLKIIWRQQP